MPPSHAGNVVPDTSLGLTADQVALLRQHQVAAAATAGSSSSRAASRASSQGMLMLDTGSLETLSRHFDRILSQIQNRMAALEQQLQAATMSMYDAAGNLVTEADAVIERTNELMAQMDELDLEWEKIGAIRDIVGEYRRRTEELEREFERAGGNSGGHRSHGHSSRRSHGHGHGHSSSRHRH